jgi:transcriptional regulator with XRE-family HTH domain
MTPDYLRHFMQEHQLTASDLAAITGKTPRTVRLWLSGAHPIPLTVKLLVRAVAEELINFDWILDKL